MKRNVLSRVLSAILVVLMLVVSIPFGAISAAASTTPPNVDEIYVANRLNKLADLLVGKYFNEMNTSACKADPTGDTHHYNKCKSENVVNATWFKDMFGTVSAGSFPRQFVSSTVSDYQGYSCFGFACFAQWYICSSLNTDNLIGSYIATGKFSKEFLQKTVAVGDVIRAIKDNSNVWSGHSMVVMAVDDTSITVLDSNSNGNCMVLKRVLNFGNNIYENENRTTIISRPSNYSPASLAYNAKTTPVTVTVTQAQAKLTQLVGLLEGEFFTANGEKCDTGVSGHACENCEITNVTAASWFKTLMNNFVANNSNRYPKQYYPGGTVGYLGYSCFGFATYANWYVFAGRTSDNLVGDLIFDGAATYENIKANALPGDILRFNNDDGNMASGHSVIVISFDDTNKKVNIIDCNRDNAAVGNCKVQTTALNPTIYKRVAITGACNYDRTSVIAPVDPDSPKMTVDSKRVRIGENVKIGFTFENMPDIKSIILESFVYDKTKLEIVSAEWKLSGAAMSDWDATGESAVMAFSENTDVNGVAFEIEFKALDTATEGNVTISCNSIVKQKAASGETAVTHTVVPGTLVVTRIEAGDVNGDDSVDSDDAIYLLRHTLLPTKYPINQNGDMNGDGSVDSDDAIYLLRYTLLPDRYPLKNN